ncbi:MAG TPA: hypothetical protein PKY61_02945, partial [bacterium]|nr:hypothetical protein [bacterium]
MAKNNQKLNMAEAIIGLCLANHNLAGAINAAILIDQRQLKYEEWDTAYQNMGAKKIVATLLALNNQEANVRFIAYLKAGENIAELIDSATRLSIPISIGALKIMVQRLIKQKKPALEIQIMAATRYVNLSSELLTTWLYLAKRMAVKNGNVTIALEASSRLDKKFKLSVEEVEELLLSRIKKMTEES